MKIAYGICAHKNPNQLKRLIRSIYFPGNYYLIHIDKKADIECHNSAKELARDYPNTNIIKPISIIWGGFSLLKGIMALIEQSLKIYSDWDYFIFLSGQDFPLKSQEEILQLLEQKKGINYIECFNASLREGWGDHGDALQRLEFFYFEVPFINIVKRIPIRIKNPLGNINWYGGGPYDMLTRSFCEYLVNDPFPQQVFKKLRFSMFSEESFLQTVVMNSEFKSTIITDNKRRIVWDYGASHPRTLTKEDYTSLINSDAFFARKFDETIDDEIFSMLENRISAKKNFGA